MRYDSGGGGANASPPLSPMVGFPLLLIPLAVYNIIAFLMPTVSFTDVLFKVPMVSGEAWPVTLADLMLALGIVLLLLEVVKGARPGSKFLMDHLLSLILFGGAAAEFVMWPKFGNSTYFLLVLLAMADFLGGIAQRTRRRVTYVAETTVPAPRKARRQVEAPAADAVAEPKFTGDAARVLGTVRRRIRFDGSSRAEAGAERALAGSPLAAFAAGRRHVSVPRHAAALIDLKPPAACAR